MEELDRYPGQAIGYYQSRQSWMDIDTVSSGLEAEEKPFSNIADSFGKASQSRNPALTGGGLVRSQGGWSQVVAMRGRGRREEYDERILGGGDFVHAIVKEAEDRQIRQIKHKRSGKTIQKIFDEECKERQINPLELKAGGKRSSVSAARASIAYRCREELGASAAEIARHLGVNTSCIVRAIDRELSKVGRDK
jgi:hypothetical protein